MMLKMKPKQATERFESSSSQRTRWRSTEALRVWRGEQTTKQTGHFFMRQKLLKSCFLRAKSEFTDLVFAHMVHVSSYNDVWTFSCGVNCVLCLPLCCVAGVFAVLRAWVCRVGLSVSSCGLLSLLSDPEGSDRHTPAAAHSQQDLCHRWVIKDYVAAALWTWTDVCLSESTGSLGNSIRGENIWVDSAQMLKQV